MTTEPGDVLPLAGGLRDLFRETDYTTDGVDNLLGPVATSAIGRGDLLPAVAVVTGDSRLEVLVRLFLLGQSETAEAAAFLPSEVLERAAPGQVRAALDLRPHEDDWWVAADVGWEHPPPADHVIGIGAASMTLVTATVRQPVNTALDLGTGCGIQALHLARHAEHITATDAVPRAIAMARLTFALSGFAPAAIETLSGDMFAPVAGRQFDLVVSNPPFVLAPPGVGALHYRDASGGDDSGLAPLLAGAAAALTPGGVAEVLTSWTVAPGVDWRVRPARFVPDGCDALVLLREVLDPAEHVALWRDKAEVEPAATQRALQWLDHLHRLGAEGIAYGLIVLRRSDSEPRVRFLDLTGERSIPTSERIGGWLSRADELRHAGTGLADQPLLVGEGTRLVEESAQGEAGWEPRTRSLISTAGLPTTLTIDEVTSALVAGCDGRLPLHAVAELLGVATGAPVEAILRVAADLVETGHLVMAHGSGGTNA